MKFELEQEAGKNYLTYKKQENDEIDPVAVGMMENNELACALPFLGSYQDSELNIRYDITEYESLKEKFKGKVNRAFVVDLLKSINIIIDVCNKYMIDENQVILQPDYIFCKKQSQEIRFVILPILNYKKQNINEELKSVILNFQFDDSEDRSYVVELLDYFQRNIEFSNTNFSDMISSLEKSMVNRVRTVRQVSSARNENYNQLNSQQNTSSGAVARSQAQQTLIQAQNVLNSDEKSLVEVEKKKKKGFLFHKKNKNQNNTNAKADKRTSRSKKGFGKIAIPGVEDGGYSSGNVQIPQSPQIMKEQKIDINYHAADKQDFGGTELLVDNANLASFSENNDNATGLLVEDSRHYPSLYRVSTNEYICINKPVFRIGKESSYADYCIEDNIMVSRSHADIITRGNQCFVIDQNSKNRTFLNNVPVVVHQETAIKDKDTLKLANEEFIFYA